MSSSNKGNPEFARVTALLKELREENLVHVFLSNKLTDDALDYLETSQDMRNELKSVNIPSGVAIRFSSSWFCRKESGQNVPSESKEATSEAATVTQSSQRNIKRSQKTGHVTNEEHYHSENKIIIPEVIEKREETKLSVEVPGTATSINTPEKTHSQSREAAFSETTVQNLAIESQGAENQLSPEKMEQKRTRKEKLPPTSRNPTENTQTRQRTSAKTDVRKHHARRPFGKPAEDFRYDRGNVFPETEGNTIEFKALTNESLQKLPWKIMDKARLFICGILNAGEQGTIYFGIGDSYNSSTNYSRGEIIGLEVEDLKDEICKAFQSTLEHHIKSDDGEMIKGGDMKYIKIYFVPVWELEERTSCYIVEIEVKRKWKFCEDKVYYFQKWTERPDRESSRLQELYKIEKGKWEDPVIRTCASTTSVKGIDTAKQVKGPLSQKYKEWQEKKKRGKTGKMTSEEHENKSIIVEKVETTTGTNERRKSYDLKKKVSREFECKNVNQEQETKVESAKSDMDGSLATTTEENTKSVENTLQEKYEKTKQLLRMPSQDTFDSHQFSNDVHESLRELNSKENDYILVANKTPLQYRGSTCLAFLQAIPWMAVFDLFDPKTKEDGLYFILNKTSDSPPVTTKLLGDLKQTEEKATRGTTWILRDQTMHESKWIHNSKDCLCRAMSTYHERAPSGRIHCVILVLSEEHLREMADIIDSCVSIIGNEANKCVTILSENKDFGVELSKLLQPEVRKDLKNPCSIFGFPLEFLRKSIEEMLGDVAYEDKDATTELPFWNGKNIPVLNKRINSLTDLEVYCPKPKLSSSHKEVKAARDNFYKGEVIKQLNLDNNDDIERTLLTALTTRIDRPLKRLSVETSEDATYVEMVSLIYESGSGATTLGRRILWNQKQRYRCAVVKAISENTGRQIEDLQRFGYETDRGIIPPVLILVDNFPEHLIYYLRDNLCKMNTKCVMLNTIPMAIPWEKKVHDDCLKLEKLDGAEIQRVKKILANVEDKSEQEKDAAVEKIKREKRFIWLGLELFGQQYNKIRKRLSYHIQDIISHNVRDHLKGAYEKILRFCCLLDYYSKGRSIYPHPCIADILYAHGDLKGENMNQIEKIHDKFGGLLLEDYSETEGYHGWRPAHFLVGEVVQEEMNYVETAKMLVKTMNSGNAFAKTFLIDNTVMIFLKREKRSESSPQNINDADFTLEDISGPDEFDSLEVQTRYSALVMAVMQNENPPSDVLNVLDLLVTLIENVHTTQHKARTLQQIARVFAYEIGMKEILKEIEPLVTRINKEFQLPDQSLRRSATDGFAIAHHVIDHAIELQNSFVNHLVTKATFFKVKLRDLYKQTKDFSTNNEESKNIIAEAMNTTKKGIQAYDNALEKSPDGYLHAMVGKIQTIIALQEIFKTHSSFTLSNAGPDESFKNYITSGDHPDALTEVLTKDDLDYFLGLANKVVQYLNEFFGELKLRKRQYEKHEQQELVNAKIRAMALRKKFYQVTKRDQRNERIVNDTGCKEDIVHDLLYKHEETPYSTWKKLPLKVIERIYTTLNHAIPRSPVNHDSMLICARAALEVNVKVDELFQHIQLWSRHFPNSIWCHMFNYMIHFPVPSGTLKPNVQMVKQSADFCKNSGPRIRERYRKSGAEYLLGKGTGLNVILSSHKVSPDSVEHKIDFWRSLELYEKLERLRGEKILGRKGVLSYKGIEIMFDNDRYPKESRDELWFCLGFTLNGPYAYDPIDEDTYKRMEEDFRKRKENGVSKASEGSQDSRADDRTIKTAWKWNNQASSVMTQPVSNTVASRSSDRRKERSNIPAVKSNSEAQRTKTLKRERTGTTYYITEGEWKSNKKLMITKRSKEGHQQTFKPKFKDQDGKIHHGAFVKRAPKSSECQWHTEKKSVPENCPFAHSWKGDYVQQTVCNVCTQSERYSCKGEENEHDRHIFVLGHYFTESGEIWLP